MLDRADVAALFTVRGFLGADYPATLRADSPSLRCLDRIVVLDGVDGLGRSGSDMTFDDHLAMRDPVDPDEATRRIVLDRSGRRRRRDLHVGHHRAPEGRDAGARRVRSSPSPAGPVISACGRAIGISS